MRREREREANQEKKTQTDRLTTYCKKKVECLQRKGKRIVGGFGVGVSASALSVQ
jgi:hypothetical protein